MFVSVTTMIRKKRKYGENYMEVMENSVKEMDSSDIHQLCERNRFYYMAVDKVAV